jgi:hypothetical protein
MMIGATRTILEEDWTRMGVVGNHPKHPSRGLQPKHKLCPSSVSRLSGTSSQAKVLVGGQLAVDGSGTHK